MVRPALKSGSELIVSVSAELPAIDRQCACGVGKIGCFERAALSRESVLPLAPSSPSVAVFGPAGRLK